MSVCIPNSDRTTAWNIRHLCVMTSCVSFATFVPSPLEGAGSLLPSALLAPQPESGAGTGAAVLEEATQGALALLLLHSHA